MKNDPLLDEIHAIRQDLYEQTKDMTSEEKIAYLRELVEPIHKKYGITPI
jgi:hypothetical protein